ARDYLFEDFESLARDVGIQRRKTCYVSPRPRQVLHKSKDVGIGSASKDNRHGGSDGVHRTHSDCAVGQYDINAGVPQGRRKLGQAACVAVTPLRDQDHALPIPAGTLAGYAQGVAPLAEIRCAPSCLASVERARYVEKPPPAATP